MSAIANQIAVITGASSGIGKAIAFALAAEGATLCLLGRRQESLDAALLPMLKTCRGQIAFINSSVGLNARATVGQYAATKRALKAIAHSLREEVNPYQMRVISVFPGRTATPLQAVVHQLEGKPYHPERLMQPEDVAAALINALCLPLTAEITDINIRPLQKRNYHAGRVPRSGGGCSRSVPEGEAFGDKISDFQHKLSPKCFTPTQIKKLEIIFWRGLLDLWQNRMLRGARGWRRLQIPLHIVASQLVSNIYLLLIEIQGLVSLPPNP